MSRARDIADLAGSADAGGLTGRNLIINGAMTVAQRGTSSTSAGYQTVDRYKNAFSGVAVTQSQETLTSGDPYDAGFRNFYRQTNASVSSATSAYLQVEQRLEARNISQSGWNYKSSNSYITLSFWARSSLAGTYYVHARTFDGTEYRRNLSFTLVADTWKKIELTIAGNSNLQIDNDAESGLSVWVVPYYGTDFTGGEEVSTTDWYDRNGQTDAYFPDYAQNWANTASATFDITGVQLEVGETATPFEHEDYGTTLQKCFRYFQTIGKSSGLTQYIDVGGSWGTNQGRFVLKYTRKRASASVDCTGGDYRFYDMGSPGTFTSITAANATFAGPTDEAVLVYGAYTSGTLTAGNACQVYANSSCLFTIDAEL